MDAALLVDVPRVIVHRSGGYVQLFLDSRGGETFNQQLRHVFLSRRKIVLA